jgi:P-type E1-E2 ATPase
MERLGQTNLVAFDKTGTLTAGSPRLAAVRLLPGGPLSDPDRVLTLAASAEHASEHPLAAAVVTAAREAGVPILAATDFTATPGRGVSARVDGHTVAVLSPAHLVPRAQPGAERLVTELADGGHSAAVVTVDGTPAAVLGFTDRIRPAAADTTRQLTLLTGRRPTLLTGDNPAAAARLADEVGITDVRAGLLPQDKVAAVRALQTGGTRVLVVGDGVNDAPALAAAHVGIAMGRTGSDLAVETADAVIVRDDLTTIPAALALSRRARRYVIANLTIAATFIAVLATWDIAGHLPLPIGVAGHEGSTIIVGLNGLRLLHAAAWSRPAGLDLVRRAPARGPCGGARRAPVATGRWC